MGRVENLRTLTADARLRARMARISACLAAGRLRLLKAQSCHQMSKRRTRQG